MNPALKALIRRALPRAIGPRRILGGPLKGERIVTSWHDYPAAILGRTERPLLDWFARNVAPGQTWIDIGAHYGYTAIALAKLVGSRGRVFAFEPMLTSAGHLSRTRALGNFGQMTILPMGLAAGDDLTVHHATTVRGMIDATGAGWKEALVVARFDWLWPQICGGAPRIDGVKIDVQGMELQVLRGMRDTVVRDRPKLVVELHHGVDRAEVRAFIAGLGYSSDAVPVEPVPGETTAQYLDDRSYYFPVR